MKKIDWKLFAISISSINLVFLTVWRGLIFPTTGSYHSKFGPTQMDIIVAVALLLIFSVVLYFLLTKFANSGNRILVYLGNLILLGLVLICINSFRISFQEQITSAFSSLGGLAAVAFPSILGIVILLSFFISRKKTVAIIGTIFLILFPFSFITVFTSISGALFYSYPSAERLSTILSSTKDSKPENQNRIVWIVFDEFDYHYGLEDSVQSSQMKNFKRLQSRSLNSTNAHSPAYDTLESIPSLLIGTQVARTRYLNNRDLLLRLKDSERTIQFSKSDSVFSDLKQSGIRNAAIGWYHPYCDIYGKSLNDCYWASMFPENEVYKPGLRNALVKDLKLAMYSIPGIFRFINSRMEIEPYFNRYKEIMTNSQNALNNSDNGFVFIHLPVPHSPNIYNAKTESFSGKGKYQDNLVLSDKSLGKVLDILESNEEFDSSTIIVSSDHQWRKINIDRDGVGEQNSPNDVKEYDRIPFIVKLPNQDSSVEYKKPFNTAITRSMIGAISKNQIKTKEDLVNWLDENTK